MSKIFNYIDVLYKLMRPSNVFYIAIDGVAPRAKMNQQRSRRFRSARDREEALAARIERGEEVDVQNQFDSNCITPGTTFMARVSTQLQFFINKKLSDDEAYRGVTVILSGHEVPGEGEHKIMEYIRNNRHKRDAKGRDSSNMRHCMYGLDADLIMLSLVTHEPHFCLLREVVKYDGGNKGQPSREVLDNPTDKGFVLLHIGLLRDYIADEFSAVSAQCSTFKYSFERVIDDFILLCMLVGNDFIPSLPTIDINEGALNKLIEIYKEILPAAGYLTEKGGFANKGMPFEMLMRRIGSMETETLVNRAADAESFAQKKRKDERRSSRRAQAASAPAAASAEGDGSLEPASVVVDEGATMMSAEARGLMLSGDPQGHALWRTRWYTQKIGVKTTEGIVDVVHSYIEALMWVLEYYFRGCVSWNWFYPHHYAPLASDIIDVARHVTTTKFSLYGPLGRPFLPYEQLMSVLPSASSALLPEPYRHLMTSPDSRIIDFYPEEFDIDMEGKRADWEGVCRICFVDEARLIEALSKVWNSGMLSQGERMRNTHGYILTFYHDDTCRHTIPSPLPRLYGTLSPCRARMVAEPPLKALEEGDIGFSSGLLKGVRLGTHAPMGFPTLKSLLHSSRLHNAGVNVFGQPTKRESLVVDIKGMGDDVEITAEMVAEAILGKKCYVGWPYLKEAVVFGVSDKKNTVTRAKKGGEFNVTKHESARTIADIIDALRRDMLVKKGINIGDTSIVLHTHAVEGIIRHLDGSIHKRFSNEETLLPLQTTIKDYPGKRSRSENSQRSEVLVSEFPVGTKAVLLSKVYFGSIVHVKSVEAERVTVEVTVRNDHQIHKAKSTLKGMTSRFLGSGEVARKLQISPRALGSITSKMIVTAADSEFDVGINVRDASRGYSVPDLAKTAPIPSSSDSSTSATQATAIQKGGAEEGGQRGSGGGGVRWLYSEECLHLLRQYKTRFPFIFQIAGTDRGESRCFSMDSFMPQFTPAQNAATLREAQKWLKKQPLSRRPLVKSSSVVASGLAIQNVQLSSASQGPPTTVGLENVHPGLLMKPVQRGSLAEGLTGGKFDIGDTAVVVVDDARVPFGMGCIIVGVHDGANDGAVEVVCDENFVGGTDLHGRLVNNSTRGAIIPAKALLNVTSGRAVPTPKGFVPRVKRLEQQRRSGPQTRSQVVVGGGDGNGGVPTLPMPLGILGPGGHPLQPPPPPQSAAAAVPASGVEDGLKLLSLIKGVGAGNSDGQAHPPPPAATGGGVPTTTMMMPIPMQLVPPPPPQLMHNGALAPPPPPVPLAFLQDDSGAKILAAMLGGKPPPSPPPAHAAAIPASPPAAAAVTQNSKSQKKRRGGKKGSQ